MEIIHQLPSLALRPYVRCYWALRQELRPGLTQAVPFGCTGRTHWLITIQNTYRTTFDEGGQLPIYDSTLVGQIVRPLTHHVTATTEVIVVDFTATGLHHLWPLPVDELTGRNAEIQSVLGTKKDALVDQLRHSLTNTLRFRLLDEYLLGQLQQRPASDGRMETAVRVIQQRPGHVNVRRLADYLNCSERTLNRRFTQTVGLSPKHYVRVQRFLQVRHQLEQCSRPDWHDLVATLGYYDQAHLIHEFHHFTGKAPQLYGTDHKPLHDFLRSV